MENYLIFFGKSQDFTFEVFNKNGSINKSSSVFNNFHLLESQIFTIDDASNKEILAKYNFIGSNNNKYSLLKLYSLAQAFDGNRISGSTFGVAFLSTSNLKITSVNNKLLNLLKTEFAKLSLNNKKFNKSNFSEDVNKIWKSFVQEGYFDKITITEPIIISKSVQKQKAFLVSDILSDSIELDNEINNTSRLYFSNDIEHLKRTEQKWGSKFNFFHKVNNNYVKYEKETKKPLTSVYDNNEKSINDYKIENSDLKYDNQELLKQLEKTKKYFKKKIKLFTAISFLLFLTTVAFFFTDSFIPSSQPKQVNPETATSNSKEETKSKERKISKPHIRINVLDNNHINRMADLQTNLKNFRDSKNKLYQSIKLFDAIRRDCDSLGIDLTSFYKKHSDLKVKSDSISLLLSSKYLKSLSTKEQLRKYLKFIKKTDKEKLSTAQNDTLKALRAKTKEKINNAK